MEKTRLKLKTYNHSSLGITIASFIAAGFLGDKNINVCKESK